MGSPKNPVPPQNARVRGEGIIVGASKVEREKQRSLALWGKDTLIVLLAEDESQEKSTQSGVGQAKIQMIKSFSGDCSGILEPIKK